MNIAKLINGTLPLIDLGFGPSRERIRSVASGLVIPSLASGLDLSVASAGRSVYR